MPIAQPAQLDLNFVSSSRPVFHRTMAAMNTRFTMLLPGIDEAAAAPVAEEVEAELRTLERLMSQFSGDGPLAFLNSHAAQAPVKVPRELWRIIVHCWEYWRLTDHTFDIAVGALSRLWREARKEGIAPSREQIEEARAKSGFEHLILDERGAKIRFSREGAEIDLGGIGKGIALDCMALFLREEGAQQALLSFGESSITAMGTHPNGPAWPIGIANLFNPTQTLHTFELKDASLSTSGNAPFNTSLETEFGHIVDPRTGRPIDGYRTLSVVAASATEAEVLSTTLLLTPAAQRAGLLARFSASSAVEIVYHRVNKKHKPSIEWRYER